MMIQFFDGLFQIVFNFLAASLDIIHDVINFLFSAII